MSKSSSKHHVFARRASVIGTFLSSLGLVSAAMILSARYDTRVAAAQDLADVIERAEKSVVRIEVKSSSGDSLGSGFIVDSKGTLVTNVHVLAGATSARAFLPDSRSFNLMGTLHLDPSRDIAVAVIASPEDAIPPIRVSSATPRKGESVVALGSPHGLSFTATTGVVSAIRPAAELSEETGRSKLQGTWIQIDAALSPGNSGGPIINSSGEVVAMSTLASQGSAQNLNFGISAGDIRAALDKIRPGSTPIPLSQGAALLKMREKQSGGSGGSGGIPVKEVPVDAIQAYAKLARDTFKDLTREMRLESERLKNDLKEMRKGQTSIPPNAPEPDADIVRVKQPGKRPAQWFFRSETIKNKEIASADLRMRELNKLTVDVKDLSDKKSELLLLTKYGPKLDPRRVGSVGFMNETVVLHAFNEHDAMVVYNDVPYLMVLESTAGLSLGQEIVPTAAFVAGTATAAARGGGTSSFTVLQSVSEREIREAIFAASSGGGSESTGATAVAGAGSGPSPRASSGDSYRTWYDRSGGFSVEAVLLSSDEKEVRLRKRDGKVIAVPRNKLSDADLKYLSQ
ncbi:MAG: trypsin-like peptidase domain-containing protein [Pirellulales bacterium]